MKNEHHVKRRSFLRQSAASVLAAGLWPGAHTARAEAGNAKAEPFDFVVVNDTHYRDAKCGDYLTKALAQIQAAPCTRPAFDHRRLRCPRSRRRHPHHKHHRRLHRLGRRPANNRGRGLLQQLSAPRKPELILLAGDLATDGRKNELGPMKDILSAVKCPVHVTPGNHDYEPDKSGKQYDAIFPKQRNYVVQHKGWTILCYDSTLHIEYGSVAVQPNTLAWLDKTLPKLDRGRPMIVFTHFPLGDGVPMRSTNAEAVLKRFEKHNLRAVFTGHFHGLTEKKHGDIPICGNRCLAFSRGNHDGSKEKGYFEARAESEKVSHEFREF